MALPWLRILDTVVGIGDLALSKRAKTSSTPEAAPQTAAGGGALGLLETHLTGVVVAALKEAFDRDSRRLDLEHEQINAERQRAERALRLELLRQAGDRELARLRLVAVMAAVSWIGTLFFSARLLGGPPGARAALGIAWLLLLAAFASSFVGQSQVAESASRTDERAVDSGLAGAFALWLIVLGLALVGVAVLVG